MYIRSIKLRDLRAFTTARLEFLYPGRKLSQDPFETPLRQEIGDPRHANINVVLGVNGSGKSTVLEAIALAFLSMVSQSGYTPRVLIRRRKRAPLTKAGIELQLALHPADTPDRKLAKDAVELLACSVDKTGDYEFLRGPPADNGLFKEMFVDRSPAFLLMGYGVFRRTEAASQGELQSRQKIRLPRYDRVYSLFEDSATLIPLSSWFPTLEDAKRRSEIIALINRMTPSTVRFEGKVVGGEMIFKYRGLELPFAALSAGYRGHLGWVGDLLYRLAEVTPPGQTLRSTPGVVLVDEIDAHLHPEWQQEIIGALANALPRIQFILTTHSPLITGTLERGNINVVSRKGTGAPVVEPPEQEMYGLSADQILMTDLFGLDSTRDKAFAAELQVVQRKAARGDAEASVDFIRKAAIGKAADNYTSKPINEPPDWLKQMAAKK